MWESVVDSRNDPGAQGLWSLRDKDSLGQVVRATHSRDRESLSASGAVDRFIPCA